MTGDDVPGRQPPPPPAPHCALCGLPIHVDPTSATGHRHAASLRVPCADGRGNATPART